MVVENAGRSRQDELLRILAADGGQALSLTEMAVKTLETRRAVVILKSSTVSELFGFLGGLYTGRGEDDLAPLSLDQLVLDQAAEGSVD
jgi:hypothetical protein